MSGNSSQKAEIKDVIKNKKAKKNPTKESTKKTLKLKNQKIIKK